MNNKINLKQIILFIIYLGMLIFFMYECFQNGDSAGNQASIFSNIIAKIHGFFKGEEIIVDDNYRLVISKLFGHYGYFCVLGLVSILFYMTITRFRILWRFMIHFGVGFIFAIATEFIAEAATSGRNASFVDVLIDSAGLLTFSGIYIIIYIIIMKKRRIE